MMHAQNYKVLWDAKASTTQGAMLSVDGSANEDVLRMTGAYTARQVDAALHLQLSDRAIRHRFAAFLGKAKIAGFGAVNLH